MQTHPMSYGDTLPSILSFLSLFEMCFNYGLLDSFLDQMEIVIWERGEDAAERMPKNFQIFFLPPKKSKKENFKFCPEHFCYHLPNTYTFTGLWNSLQINILIQNQCDQIGLLLNDLGNKELYNSSPNLYQRLGYNEKCHFWWEKLL